MWAFCLLALVGGGAAGDDFEEGVDYLAQHDFWHSPDLVMHNFATGNKQHGGDALHAKAPGLYKLSVDR